MARGASRGTGRVDPALNRGRRRCGRAGARLLPLLLCAACSEASSHPTESPTRGQETIEAGSLAVCEPRSMLEMEVVASGLETPWDVAFLTDGRILVTERAGRIRLVDERGLRDEPWAEVGVEAAGEAGLLGIDVGQDENGRDIVYVAGTFRSDGETSSLRRLIRRFLRSFTAEDGYPVRTRILAFETGGEIPAGRVIVDGVPAGQLHVGGALRVGPDGMLWLGTGDAGDPALSQQPPTRAGKVLRFTLEGAAPSDNPGRGSAVYARGLRNVQAIAWQEGQVSPLATDHGPSGLLTEGRRRGGDELNHIRPGRDYGWPVQAGAEGAVAGFASPFLLWHQAIAPAGMAFARGGPWEGDIIVAGLRGRDVFRVAMEGGTPVCIEPLLDGRFGRMRAVRAAPDGWIYITTSNRDGRGTPGEDDDWLLRVRPLRPSAPRPPG